MKTLNQKMKRIGSERRQKVKVHANGLIVEEKTLQELRQVRKLTQVPMAKPLASARMSFPVWKGAATFAFYITNERRGHGRNLSLVAEFPDREPVVRSAIAEVEP